MGDVIRITGFKHHQYADETQVYFAVRSGRNCAVDMKIIEECTLALQGWFLLNDLQPNPSKSEVTSLGTVSQCRASTGAGTVSIVGFQLSFVDKIKSLEAYIDADLSFDAEVNTVSRTCNYQIRALRHIRNNLPLNVAKR